MPSCAFCGMMAGHCQSHRFVDTDIIVPFLIFVTALSGFFGTKTLADEAVRLLFQTWPQQVAAPSRARFTMS